MGQDNVFAYIKERDLHEHYMKMLEPNGDLWRGIEATDGADNKDFKRGAIWSIAWFLISVCANCEKIYLKEKNESEEENKKEEQE